MDIIHCAMERTFEAKDKLHDKLANVMAKDVAVISGQVLSAEEMQNLVDELFRTPLPARTPDGRTIIHIVSDNEIERFFTK